MNIQNIQIAQGSLRAIEGKINSGKGNISAESDFSRQEINLPEAQENKILPDNSSASKQQKDALQIVFPPFFPLGNTQGIYSVMIQAKADSSTSSDSLQAQKPDKAANTEVIATRQQERVAPDEDKMIKNSAPETKGTTTPGSVLDFKV